MPPAPPLVLDHQQSAIQPVWSQRLGVRAEEAGGLALLQDRPAKGLPAQGQGRQLCHGANQLTVDQEPMRGALRRAAVFAVPSDVLGEEELDGRPPAVDPRAAPLDESAEKTRRLASPVGRLPHAAEHGFTRLEAELDRPGLVADPPLARANSVDGQRGREAKTGMGRAEAALNPHCHGQTIAAALPPPPSTIRKAQVPVVPSSSTRAAVSSDSPVFTERVSSVAAGESRRRPKPQPDFHPRLSQPA